MIETRDLVPKVYSDSRDYQVFLKLLDLVVCSIKSDNDHMVSYINPDKCKSRTLPYLASYVGYEYDYNLSYEVNRLITRYFKTMINSRGSQTGVKLATAIAITANDVNMINQNTVELIASTLNIGYEDGTISVYIPSSSYIFKIFDLLEKVRPAGVKLKLMQSERINYADKVEISLTSSHTKSAYSEDERSYLHTGDSASQTSVGFSEIIDNE